MSVTVLELLAYLNSEEGKCLVINNKGVITIDLIETMNDILEDYKELNICNFAKKQNRIDLTKEEPRYKKKSIPKALRDNVWDRYFKGKMDANCYVCRRDISFKNFECGHILSERQGGETVESNLRPICSSCNKSMATRHMEEFKKYFDYEINKDVKLKEEIKLKEEVKSTINETQPKEEVKPKEDVKEISSEEDINVSKSTKEFVIYIDKLRKLPTLEKKNLINMMDIKIVNIVRKIKANDLFQLYLQFCEQNKLEKLNNVNFGKEIKLLIGWNKSTCIVYDLDAIRLRK